MTYINKEIIQLSAESLTLWGYDHQKEKVQEELQEMLAAIQSGYEDAILDEIPDIIISMAHLCNIYIKNRAMNEAVFNKKITKFKKQIMERKKELDPVDENILSYREQVLGEHY